MMIKLQTRTSTIWRTKVPQFLENFQWISFYEVLLILNQHWFMQNRIWGTRCEIAFKWMLHNCTNESKLVQVMAWCHQATSHYWSRCWSRSMVPYGLIRPQWIKICSKGTDWQKVTTGLGTGLVWWYLTGNKPLIKPMESQFTDANMHHRASDNGWCQAIIWNNAGILLLDPCEQTSMKS